MKLFEDIPALGVLRGFIPFASVLSRPVLRTTSVPTIDVDEVARLDLAMIVRCVIVLVDQFDRSI